MGEARAVIRKKVDPVPQRVLAQRIRYYVDQARYGNEAGYVKAIRVLIDENPNSSRSSHVAHNLGRKRLEWLHERGLLL